MMEIRNYRKADRDAVVALWTEAFGNESGHNDPGTAIDKKVALNDELFFVAVENENVVGTVVAGYDGHRGWIYSLAVSVEHRRRGIATTLMRKAEWALRKIGCPKVNLQVRTTNAEVVSFYESIGYAIEERISMGKLM